MTGVRPIAHLRNGTAVAAWMFKAKPEIWDVIGAIEAIHADPGAPRIDSWQMAASYRVGLVRAGQPCVLWVTGGRHAATTGVWGIGEVTRSPELDPMSEEGRPRYDVGIELELATVAVPLVELAVDERFAHAEIIRAPRVSSPVALTATEFEAIEDAWPARIPGS